MEINPKTSSYWGTAKLLLHFPLKRASFAILRYFIYRNQTSASFSFANKLPHGRPKTYSLFITCIARLDFELTLNYY